MPNNENTDCEKCRGTGFADYAASSIDTCRWCDGTGTVNQSLTEQTPPHELVKDNYKLTQGWDNQFDDCEPCEFCGNLVKEGRKYGRLSLAITELYTFGLITSAHRDQARRKLKNLVGQRPK